MRACVIDATCCAADAHQRGSTCHACKCRSDLPKSTKKTSAAGSTKKQQPKKRKKYSSEEDDDDEHAAAGGSGDDADTGEMAGGGRVMWCEGSRLTAELIPICLRCRRRG